MRHRPYSLRRGDAVFSFSRPSQNARGTARRPAHPSFSSHLLIEGVAPFGAPSRRLPSGAGPRFAHGPLRFASSSDLATPSGSIAPSEPRANLGGPPSASSWQGPVVVPGGAPAPPECEVTSLARGRRAIPVPEASCRNAPRRDCYGNISMVMRRNFVLDNANRSPANAALLEIVE